MAQKQYPCKLCSASFTRFYTYKKHVEESHITPPEPETKTKPADTINIQHIQLLDNKFKCDTCNATFSTKYTLKRHCKKSCKPDIVQILQSLPPESAATLMTTLINSSKNTTNNIDKRKITNNNTNNTDNTNNGTINTNNGTINNDNRVLNQHIHINPIGQESLDHLTKEDKIAILRKGMGAVAALVNAIMEVPENRNIAITDKRNNKVMFVNQDGKVEIGALTKVIAMYTTNNIDRIDEYLGTYYDELPLTDKTIQRLIECIGYVADDLKADNKCHVDSSLFDSYHEKCMDQIQDILTVNKKPNVTRLNKYLEQ